MKTISIYQVEDTPIGSGGMCRVYRGTGPKGLVAIKEILPEFASDFEIRTRTEREVEMLQQLNNDSIVKVYDHFPYGDNFCIVMEYVDGWDIEKYVANYGAIPYERATRFMVQILEAMQYVHEMNLVHRDIKPSNIMIRTDERICILDFGIAKDLGNQDGVNKTLIGTQIGSNGYMSPEQADGFDIDHRSDIYALGCVFYYMLTGHHAYDTLYSDFETRSNITNTPFPRLSKHSKKSFPRKLQEILDHATNKNMLMRYQSCREYRKDLECLLPSASSSHTIISKNKAENIFITVGREGCDISVVDNLMKVSRKHLEITYRQFTGGRYYVITDQSSNGTLVNGRRLNKYESENIPADGAVPEVFLACDTNYPLNWEEVKGLIASKLKAVSTKDSDGPTGETIAKPVPPVPPIKNVSFVDAIKMFFTKAFDFRGRSRRKEYWYVVLANAIIFFPFQLYMIISTLNGDSVKPELFVFLGLYSMVIIIPGISLTLRRLHDIGKDEKAFLWGLALLIPIVNLIVFIIWIVWMATESDPRENKWGLCPK